MAEFTASGGNERGRAVFASMLDARSRIPPAAKVTSTRCHSSAFARISTVIHPSLST